jgi:hypothetical protein
VGTPATMYAADDLAAVYDANADPASGGGWMGADDIGPHCTAHVSPWLYHHPQHAAAPYYDVRSYEPGYESYDPCATFYGWVPTYEFDDQGNVLSSSATWTQMYAVTEAAACYPPVEHGAVDASGYPVQPAMFMPPAPEATYSHANTLSHSQQGGHQAQQHYNAAPRSYNKNKKERGPSVLRYSSTCSESSPTDSAASRGSSPGRFRRQQQDKSCSYPLQRARSTSLSDASMQRTSSPLVAPRCAPVESPALFPPPSVQLLFAP